MIKIRSITFEKHPILGNLHLNFCNKDGSAADTVILAGENGSGKSTVLNELYKLANHQINYPLRLEIEENGKAKKLSVYWRRFTSDKPFLYLEDGEKYDQLYGSDESKREFPFAGIFSDVDINFKTNEISTVSSMTLDGQKGSRRSTNDLPSKVKQLLIDIQALDDSEFTRTAHNNPEVKVKDLVIAERMPRFTNAFSVMFDNLRYSHIENRNNHKEVLFCKNGKYIPIDKLSSGEKQIVYRGCFLLKDVNALNGAFVFIDEPEISLHPTWQMKIMDYYKGIFTNEEGVQTSQIFAVTHSPFVIHNENRRNDKVIVLTRDEQGNVIVKDKPEYYKCDSIEAVQDAFSIQSFSADKPTVYLEGRTDEMYFNKALEVYGMTVPFQFRCVGHMDERGKEFNMGDKSVDAAFQFLVSRNLPFKNFCLKDCDTHREPQKRNNTIILSIPPYENGKGIRKGIENALVLDNVDLTPYYIRKKTRGEYGEQKEIESFEKMACCNGICALSDNILVEVFAHLKDTIDELVRLYYEE